MFSSTDPNTGKGKSNAKMQPVEPFIGPDFSLSWSNETQQR